MAPYKPSPSRPTGLIAGRLAVLAVWIATTEVPPEEHQIVKYCADNWQVNKRQALRYLCHARQLLKTRFKRDIENIRSESLARLELIARDPHEKAATRIKAENRIAHLLGLDAPRQMEVAVAHVQATRKAHAIDWTAAKTLAMEAHIPANQAVIDLQPATKALPEQIESIAEPPPVVIPEQDRASAQPGNGAPCGVQHTTNSVVPSCGVTESTQERK